MTELRIGVIGLGRLADNIHLPTLATMEGIDLVAACDVDEHRLATIAAKYRIPDTYTDHRALIERAGIDAIFVLTTPATIAAVALDVLNAGVAAFLEKPPALTAAETRELVAAAERSGAIAMVGFNRRFQPLVQKAKRLIYDAGPLASVIVEFHPYNFEHYRRTGFPEETLRRFHAAQSIHAVDLICYLGGEVVSVYGHVGHHFSPYGDTFGALLEFASGATGHVICNYTSPARVERAELHGQGVLVRLEGPERPRQQGAWPFETATVYQGDLVAEYRNAGENDAYNGGYVQEVASFLDCLRAGRAPERPGASLPDALATMNVIEAILCNWKGPLAASERP
jgi:predicted dehydrogenase